MRAGRAPRRRIARRLALALLGVLAGAGLLEGAVRARHYLRSGSLRRAHAFVLDARTGLTIPLQNRHGAVRTDSHGFRSPEVEVPKPPGTLRLAFLGASTTFCAEASSNEATWPHLVWKAVAAAYPRARVDYVNAAVGGYGVESSIQNFERRVAPCAPDVVVIYHATNDIAGDTRELARERGVYSGHADRDSWLARWSMAYFLIEKNVLFHLRSSAARREAGRLGFEPRALSAGFRERLERLVHTCQRSASLVVLVTFAPRVRADQTPDERLAASASSLYYMPYLSPAGLLAAFEEYDRVIGEVARATGALLVEGEDTIPADAVHYADSVHFTDAGCARMAARIAGPLVASETLRRLAER